MPAVRHGTAWPDSLVQFVLEASRLALPRCTGEGKGEGEGSSTAALATERLFAAPVPIAKALARGMKPKKVSRAGEQCDQRCAHCVCRQIHEVSRLAAAVAAVCERSRASAVLDFGSGKGYLGKVRHQRPRAAC